MMKSDILLSEDNLLSFLLLLLYSFDAYFSSSFRPRTIWSFCFLKQAFFVALPHLWWLQHFWEPHFGPHASAFCSRELRQGAHTEPLPSLKITMLWVPRIPEFLAQMAPRAYVGLFLGSVLLRVNSTIDAYISWTEEWLLVEESVVGAWTYR